MNNEFYRDYRERVMPALQKQHSYKNVHQIPKVEKVVINTSVGSQSDVKQALEEAKAANEATLKKQDEMLQQLDEIQKAAEQLKILAKRST